MLCGSRKTYFFFFGDAFFIGAAFFGAAFRIPSGTGISASLQYWTPRILARPERSGDDGLCQDMSRLAAGAKSGGAAASSVVGS